MWDEQFHAVVAKNMILFPFKPMFIVDPILNFDYKNWTANHIWLHKQPLFLWQIALSFKLFGTNEFALRVPGIFMSSFSIFFIYRIGSIIYNKQAGFYAGVLYTGSFFLIELTSGRMPTDHNDIAFLFYVTGSLWAWFEYTKTKNKYWLIFIGLFSGFAILIKWLTGLLVYSGWFIAILFSKDWRSQKQSYLDFLKSLLVTVAVALPWQIYILIRFPLESMYEFNLNSRHFFEALEGHGGTFLYHFEAIKEIYGYDFIYIIIASIIIFFLTKISFSYKIALTTWIVIVYGFFTIAETKMMAFTIIAVPLVYLLVGIVIAYLINLLKQHIKHTQMKRWIPVVLSVSLVFFLFFHFLKHDKLSLEKTPKRKEVYNRRINTTQFYKGLNTIFPLGNQYYFNTLPHDNAKVIFYTGKRARSAIPTEQEINKLKEQSINIVVFDNGRLPDYIADDNHIAKVISVVWINKFKGKTEVYY